MNKNHWNKVTDFTPVLEKFRLNFLYNAIDSHYI